MLPNQPTGKRPAAQAKNGLGEESRLDEAMERADQLLVSSLKKEERRRGRCLLFIVLGILVVGGLTMSVILCVVFLNPGTNVQVLSPSEKNLAVQSVRHGATPREAQAAQTKTVAFDNSDDAGRLSAEGWSLWQKQDVNAAAAKFAQAVKLDPKNVSAWNGLGWSSFNGGNREAAAKAFHKAIAWSRNIPPRSTAWARSPCSSGNMPRQKNTCSKRPRRRRPPGTASPRSISSRANTKRRPNGPRKSSNRVRRIPTCSSCWRRQKKETCRQTCER